MVPGFCRVAYYLTRTDLTLTAQLAPTNSILKERACWLGGRALRGSEGGRADRRGRRRAAHPASNAGVQVQFSYPGRDRPGGTLAGGWLAVGDSGPPQCAALAARKTPAENRQRPRAPASKQAPHGPHWQVPLSGSRHRHMTIGCATSADSDAPHCRDGDGASTGCEIHAERLTFLF